jgi:aspartate aminotransferase
MNNTNSTTSVIKTSKLANAIEPSITMEITSLAKSLRASGQDVIGFGAGEPDFDTPEFIKEAAKKAIDEGKTKYTPAAGIQELKQAICDKFKTDQGLEYTPENIVVSCGAKHTIYNLLLALVDQGDEVLIPSPYWVSYPDQVRLAGGTPVIVEADESTAFKLTPSILKAAITPKTKILMLNSPSNPTGMVYSRAELNALAPILEEHNITILSDEIYEKLVYAGQEHVSIATLSESLKNQTIIINGVSKAYSMTGWRIGYCAAPVNVAKGMSKIQSHSTSNPTTPSQWASIEALKHGEKDIERMKVSFNERRLKMVELLNNIDGISCVEPKGAFYAFPNISGCFGKTSKTGIEIKSSKDFCSALLQEALVACVPGIGFGEDTCIRFSYATSMTDIENGLKRLSDWVGTLK